MIFVRGNRYGEEGDGSFENPFASLNNAVKHATDKDILYLITGEESSLTESISLHPHQHLIGSSESMTPKRNPDPCNLLPNGARPRTWKHSGRPNWRR